jgi:hypothetical protein
MDRSWRDGLRSLQRQFDKVTQPFADLWHGVAWSSDALWNQQALEAHPDTILRRADGQVEYGRFFGSGDGLRRFRNLATSAYRLLLRAPRWAEITGTIRLPSPARDLTACWLGVVYTLAWTRNDTGLRADQQLRRPMDDDGEAYSYTQARLAHDVFASSATAINLLLTDAPPARGRRPARRRPARRPAAQPRPRWRRHRDGWQLCLGEEVQHTFRRNAPRQFVLLNALEAAGWPEAGIGLPHGLNYSQAKNATDALNRALANGRLRLHCHKDGEDARVSWSVTPV